MDHADELVELVRLGRRLRVGLQRNHKILPFEPHIERSVAECLALVDVSPRAPAARRAQTLQGALDLGNRSDRHATVAGCRLGLGMSEQRLNHANVLAALEQMCRKAVAKRMQRDRLAQRRGFGGLLEQPTELTRSQRLITATWKQPALFRRAADVIRGRPRLPAFPQQLEILWP